MQNSIVPTTKEWKVIQTALEHLKIEYEAVGDSDDNEAIKILDKYINAIRGRDILNDKF